MSKGITQAEFARLLGVSRSYITALKKDGRLVFTDDGLVDATASLELMEKTADPNREDVREFWANYRGATVGARTMGMGGGEISEKDGVGDASGIEDDSTYVDARARKEHALAELAAVDYRLAVGELIAVSAVQSICTDVAIQLRTQIELIPDRMSVGLAPATTLAEIKEKLRGQIEMALGDAQRSLKTKLTDTTRDNRNE